MNKILNNSRRMICLLLMLAVPVCGGSAAADEGAAPAAQVEAAAAPQAADEQERMQLQLGASGYAMSIPRSYRNGKVAIEEVQDNQVAYYFTPDSEMDFDIYQFPKPNPEMSLEAFTRKTAADFNGSNVNMRRINGIKVGIFKSREVYGGITYDVLAALMEEGDQYIEVVFWLDGENAEQEATAIINTLSEVENYDLQLGSSQFCMSVPVGYKAGELSAEAIGEGAVGCYYSENSPLNFDVYQWAKEGDTLEKYAIEEARLYEAERLDYRTINGIFLAFYYTHEEYNGQMYPTANYIFEDGDTLMEIVFWLDGEIAAKQADRILSTLRRMNG